MPRFIAFPRNVNTINLEISPIHCGIYTNMRENSTSILERDKAPKSFYRNMKGCILKANLERQGW